MRLTTVSAYELSGNFPNCSRGDEVQKSLRRALWAGLLAVAATAMVPLTQASAAVACSPAWSSTAVYVKDNVASQNSHNYTAKRWTQNESPATHSGQWDVWTDGGVCGSGTPPTTPPHTPPTPPPPHAPHHAPHDPAPDHATHHPTDHITDDPADHAAAERLAATAR